MNPHRKPLGTSRRNGKATLSRANRKETVSAYRLCRFEQMEPRCVLSAMPIQVGAVYFEDSIGADLYGDVMEITFIGGQPGTQLTRLVIDTDKEGNGRTQGDAFFDLTGEGYGSSGASPLQVVDRSGIDSVSATLVDGGTSLILEFTGFDPGEKLIISVDVDEAGFINPNAVCEGAEFEGSILTATFAAPHFYEATASDIFLDDYDARLAGRGLDLPPDDYTPGDPRPDQTAGAAAEIVQTPLPITISGTVYEDVDLDNARQTGEQGLAGVTLQLWKYDSGQYVATGATAVTDAQGRYQFDGVLPGTYRVVELQPASWYSVGSQPGTVGGQARGASTDADTLSGITLLGGEDSVNNNFGEARPASLSGTVYHDRDDDGQRDSGEEGIAGAVIRIQYLPPSGALPAAIEVTTQADGSWSVNNLRPGSYRIEELQPTGYFDGKDAAGTAGGTALNPGDSISGVWLASAQAGENYLFGELMPGSISGRVHVDLNGNVEYDASAGEELLAGVTVRLRDSQGTLVTETTTDAKGEYRFTGLHPGTYVVEEVQPAGYFDGADRVGSVGGKLVESDTISNIVLGSGVAAVRYDFTEIAPSRISGRVHVELNGDCVYQPEAGEMALSGVTVLLRNSAGKVVQEVQTDAEGRYVFDGLAPGEYTVEEIQPEGYIDGRDHVGTQGGSLLAPDSITGIVLTSGTVAENYDYCEIAPNRIAGRVFVDENGNGAYDDGETMLTGVTLRLRDGSGAIVATAKTNAVGRYQFLDLPPGEYTVEEVQPQGYFDGGDTVGTAGGSLVAPDSITGIKVFSGTNGLRYDFGELAPSSVSGRVYVDANGNGQLDAGETLLSGVIVRLRNEAGAVVGGMKTNSEGYYQFTGLAPGAYSVEEVQPTRYFDGLEHVGTAGGSLLPPDAIDGIVLISGTAAAEYDFGEIPPAGLSGYVYEDLNNNGVYEAGKETGIAGVRLVLWNAAGQATGDTAITDANGYYYFGGLRPGTYTVTQEQPEGYFDGLDTAGNAGGKAENPGDRIAGAVLKAGFVGQNYNFGELPPASIQGRVHGELDGDCVLDPGEPLLAGVTVWLLDGQGRRIDSTLTDAKGEFRFANLRPGTYGLEEIQPDGYLDGPDHPGTAGGRAAGPDSIVEIELAPGVDALHYEFCEKTPATLSGYVYQDGGEIEVPYGGERPAVESVRDGSRTADDKPIAGVVLKLCDGSGAAILDAQGREITAVTDANGYYEFTGLEPGLYSIVEVHPAGYADGLDTHGSAGGEAINPGTEPSPIVADLLKTFKTDPRNDAILQVRLNMGQEAVNYNFSEVVYVAGPPEVWPNPKPTPEFPAPDPAMPGTFDVAKAAASYYAAPAPLTIPLFGAGGGTPAYTWHLSVLNGGQPRQADGGMNAAQAGMRVDPVAWSAVNLDGATWTLAGPDGQPYAQVVFGAAGGTPVTGDWNGDGRTDVGVFLGGQWFLDLNGNGRWDEGDLWAQLGDEDDRPVTGDWDGDGKTDIGIFGPAWPGDLNAVQLEPGLPDLDNAPSGRFKNVPPDPADAAAGWRMAKKGSSGSLRADLIDHVFQYGTPEDQPVAGDWNGDGVATVGVFREGRWMLDVDGSGTWTAPDESVDFGQPGDTAVVGDWNGDGVDELAVYRGGAFYLDTNGDRRITDADRVVRMGEAGDVPVAGDFDGDGTDEVAVYHEGDSAAATRSTALPAAAGSASR